MSNNNNNLNDLKIKISDTEEEKDYSQSLSILNNNQTNKSRQPQFLNNSKKYQNEASQDYSLRKKLDLDNLSSFQLSKIYKNIRNNDIKNVEEKYENKIKDLSTLIDALNQEIKIHKKEKSSLKDEIKSIKLEKEKIIRTNNTEIEFLKEQLNNLEEKYAKEKNKNKENEQNAKIFSNKAEDYDDIFNKMKKYEKENNYLLSMNNDLNDNMVKLQKENLLINEKYLDIKSNIEQLKINNDGLKENNLFYENKIKEQDIKINNLEEEIKKLKLLNKNYEQIIADNDLNLHLSKLNNNSFIVNNKIEDEINNLKIKHEKEILNLKKEYDNIIKSKTNDFILDINEYKNKISDYELRLKDKENAVNLYKSHIDDFNSKANEEINLLKIDLDNKTNELNIKNALYKEQITAITMFQNENEKLKEKNDLLNEKLILMESDYMKQIEDEKNKNIKLKEQIFKYEEIDENLANLLNDKKNEMNLKDDKLLKNLGQKKYNQCLILINTIKIMKIEIEKLKIEKEQLNSNLKLINDQCNIYKNISDKINQPYSYLVKNLQDKDLELLKINQILSNKEQSISKLKKQCEIYEKQINTMKSDMATIINNRKQIDNLENLLTNYVNNENKKDNNMDDVDRISYFLNNFNNNVSFNNKDFNRTNSYFNKNNYNFQNNMTFPMSSTMQNFNRNDISKGKTFK